MILLDNILGVTCLDGLLQIDVLEISPHSEDAGIPGQLDCFMFTVQRVVARIEDEHARDPDVRLAKTLLSRSKHKGRQAELWVASEIAWLKKEGQLQPSSSSGSVKGLQRFKQAATRVGHIAGAVMALNKLTMGLKDGVGLFGGCQTYTD